MQPSVQPAVRQQLGMAALLDHPARFQRGPTSAHTRSTSVNIDIVEDKFIGIDGGASGEVVELFEDDPTKLIDAEFLNDEFEPRAVAVFLFAEPRENPADSPPDVFAWAWCSFDQSQYLSAP